MSDRARVVLCGAGRMGRNHLRLLASSARFELAAVVDPNPLDVDTRDLKGAPLLKSLDELSKIDFECAVVATPTATHFDVLEKLVAMKKSVLVEKPLCSTYEQCGKVLAATERAGVKLAVGHVERFNPAVRKLREVIRRGWLGTPIHYSFTRAGGYPSSLVSGNNVLLDLAVHDVDVVRSLEGPMRLEASVCHSTVRSDVYDTAEILLLAKSGASATVHVNWITPTKLRSIRVTGTRGVCFVDYILQTCELFGGNLLEQSLPESAGYERLLEMYKTTDRIQFGVTKEEPLKAELDQFHELLRTGEAGELCLGDDASRAVLLAERAVNVVRTRDSHESDTWI